jgi:hypothetical protein
MVHVVFLLIGSGAMAPGRYICMNMTKGQDRRASGQVGDDLRGEELLRFDIVLGDAGDEEFHASVTIFASKVGDR